MKKDKPLARQDDEDNSIFAGHDAQSILAGARRAQKKKIDRVLNVTGLLCPRPNLIATQTLQEMQKGETLEIICNDKNTRLAIPSLCATSSYHLLEIREEHGLLYFLIQK